MKSHSHIFLAFIGLLLLFMIGVYNLLEILNANWITDVGYEWISEQDEWGKVAKITSYMVLIFIPLFTFAFYIRNSFTPKPIVCKNGTNTIKLSSQTIVRSVKEVLHKIPAISAAKVNVWNKGDKVFVEVGSVVRAGALLPEINEEIKIRTRETMVKILGIQNIGAIKSVIEDVKFSDKEVVGKVFEQRINVKTEVKPEMKKEIKSSVPEEPKLKPYSPASVKNENNINIFKPKIDSLEQKSAGEIKPPSEIKSEQEKEKLDISYIKPINPAVKKEEDKEKK